MAQPFIIDVYSTDANGEVSIKRLRDSSLESSLKRSKIYQSFSGVFKIVIMRTIGGGGHSVMAIWSTGV